MTKQAAPAQVGGGPFGCPVFGVFYEGRYVVVCSLEEGHPGVCMTHDRYALTAIEIHPDDRRHATPDRWWWKPPEPDTYERRALRGAYRELFSKMSDEQVLEIVRGLR